MLSHASVRLLKLFALIFILISMGFVTYGKSTIILLPPKYMKLFNVVNVIISDKSFLEATLDMQKKMCVKENICCR